jgi:hypothetical protein
MENDSLTLLQLQFVDAKIVSVHRDEGSDHSYYTVEYLDSSGVHEVQTNFMRVSPTGFIHFEVGNKSAKPVDDAGGVFVADLSGSSLSSVPTNGRNNRRNEFLHFIREYYQNQSSSLQNCRKLLFQSKLINFHLFQKKENDNNEDDDEETNENEEQNVETLLLPSFCIQLMNSFTSLSLSVLSELLPSLLSGEKRSSYPFLAVLLESFFMKVQQFEEIYKAFKVKEVEEEQEKLWNAVCLFSASLLKATNNSWLYYKNYLVKTFLPRHFLLYNNRFSVSKEFIDLLVLLWANNNNNTLEILSWEYNTFHELINYYFSFSDHLRRENTGLTMAIHLFLNRCEQSGSTNNKGSLELSKMFEKIELSEEVLYPAILKGILSSSSSYGCHLPSLQLSSLEKCLVLRLFSYLPSRTLLANSDFLENTNSTDDEVNEEKWMEFLHPILKNELFHSFDYISNVLVNHSKAGSGKHGQQDHLSFLDDHDDLYEIEIVGEVTKGGQTGGNDVQAEKSEAQPILPANTPNNFVQLKLNHFEKKFHFLIMWLLFLFTIESYPPAISSQIKSSFNKFCEKTQWFQQIIHFLLKWSSLKNSSLTALLKKYANKYELNHFVYFDFGTIPMIAEELSDFQKNFIFTSKIPFSADSNGFFAMPGLETFNFQFFNLFILFKTILIFPSLLRNYWTNECPNRLEKDILLKFIQENIRIPLIANEIQKIQAIQSSESNKEESTKREGEENEEGQQPHREKFVVSGNINRNEITASLLHDESKIELVIEIPMEYPLKNVDIQVKQLIGIPESKWLKWKLMMISLINSYDKSIIEAILWWKANMEKELQGIGKTIQEQFLSFSVSYFLLFLEPCIICYSVIHSKNNSLPSISCSTCKNKFHSNCLYTWFKTSGKNSCVLCQQPMR